MSCPCCRRQERKLVFSVFLPPVLDRILESVSVLQYPKRHSLSSSTFWLQHRSSNERQAPQRKQVARVVAHGPERPALLEKRSSGSRLFGAASSNARVDRHSSHHVPREPSSEPAKALLAPTSEVPVCPALFFLLTTMSWPAAFELMMSLVIQDVRIMRT